MSETEEAQRNYEGACKTIAAMHEAATGAPGTGPRRGVVEDVADLRERAEAAEAELRILHASLALMQKRDIQRRAQVSRLQDSLERLKNNAPETQS